MTARKGRTLGHARSSDQGGAGRRVTGRAGTRRSRRFALPILLALAIPSFGVILGLGMVAWGYFDRNGQGIHDKLARTLVVDA